MRLLRWWWLFQARHRRCRVHGTYPTQRCHACQLETEAWVRAVASKHSEYDARRHAEMATR